MVKRMKKLTLAQQRMLKTIEFMGSRFSSMYEPNSTWHVLKDRGLITKEGLTPLGREVSATYTLGD